MIIGFKLVSHPFPEPGPGSSDEVFSGHARLEASRGKNGVRVCSVRVEDGVRVCSAASRARRISSRFYAGGIIVCGASDQGHSLSQINHDPKVF